MITKDVIEALNRIQMHIDSRFDKMEDNIKDIREKCLQIEKTIGSGILQNSTGENIHNVALMSSISSSEEKIKFLNNSIDVTKQEDLIETIKSRCIIQDNNIHSILNQEISIYDMVVEIIFELTNDSNSKFLYGFPTSKNILYYWCNNKQTWAKLSKIYLQNIFEAVQMKMILKYHIMISQDSKMKKECVENGDYIYADNFDKKYTDFRKSMFTRFV
jgi:hypothetical protein